ncbi:hypothetical protein [Haloquadratum walsbyi]|uniref:hypothetical protein n=1 Tax=Haloquadratum walsbyi TaxID=293091 RepID=UPI0026F3556E|nr:hypothetical protein [Haloquadratum walsbyi]
MSVVLNQDDCEVGLIDPNCRLDDWRETVDTPLRADALRVAVPPVGSADDA